MLHAMLLTNAYAPTPDDRCVIRANTTALVFNQTGTGGTGPKSALWEHHFWSWWSESKPSTAPVWQSLTAAELFACDLASYPSLVAWVQPGGNAYDYDVTLGYEGKKQILGFLASGGLYVGTCAGWFYASSGYYWEYDTNASDKGYWHYPALLGLFPPVEGSITDVQDMEKPPEYALTKISSGHTAIYYGGPTIGWRHTSPQLPPGAVTHARYSDVPHTPPAIVSVRPPEGAGHLMLFSVHLEAFEGVGITGLTTAERKANYALRRTLIESELAHAISRRRERTG